MHIIKRRSVRNPALALISVCFSFLLSGNASAAWEPPTKVSREQIVKSSQSVLSMPDIKIKQREDVFRVDALGMDWDIGSMVYEPEDPAKIAIGPDGKKVGIFLMHGGTGDYTSLDGVARTIAAKFGFKVTSMTFPGRLYLNDPSRKWPGDSVNHDGSARTPLWKKDLVITRDQYDIVKDTSQRAKYGTFISLKAKEGTEFYYRMAAWPVAFDEAMREANRRQFPVNEYSVYIHGHSTGGPFAMIASQRVPNIVGILGYGTSPFGYMYPATGKGTWKFPFNYLRMRTWVDDARYTEEDLGKKGYSWPLLMETVFERCDVSKTQANFKAEDFIHKNSTKSLEDAARVMAKRLNLDAKGTEALVQRYAGYLREMSGPGTKPVPPFLSIHGGEDDTVTYQHVQKVMPMFAAMKPAPKVNPVLLETGVHMWGYMTDKDLPQGVSPAVAALWKDAIKGGYFLK
jgi:pimeloyl-ACP methyl ester carboxylesterase